MTQAPDDCLLPCPFCGGEARGWFPMPDKPSLNCVDCPACDVEGGWCSTKDQAIKQWNTRARTPSINTRMQGWQPIETAPRDGTRVLVFGIERGFHSLPRAFEASFYNDRWCRGGEYSLPRDPTHWMPLPAPPAEAEISTQREGG